MNEPLNRETAVAAGLALLLFTIGIWNQEPTGFDIRFTLFAEEMLRYGPTWFPTTWGGRPYPDYPALSTFLIWIPARLAGEVLRLWVVLPSAIAGALTVALTYRLVRPLSLTWALTAVCLEFLTVTFLVEARFTSLDLMVTAVTTGCFLLAYAPADSGVPVRRLAALLGLLFLGFCLRGPLGLVVPGGVVFGVLALERRWRPLVRFGAGAALLLTLCCLVLLFLARRTGGEAFLREVWQMQVAGRVSGISGPGVLYYLESSIGNYALAFPFALAVSGAVLPHLLREERRGPFRLLAAMIAWSAILLVGLSIPEAKKARYLLPIVPAIAILASYPLALAPGEAAGVLRWIRRILLGVLRVFPGLLLAVLAGAWYYAGQQGTDFAVDPRATVILLAVGQAAALLAGRLLATREEREVAVAVIAALALWTSNLLVREPLLVELHGSRPFVRQIESTRTVVRAPVALYRMTRDNLANHYLVNAPSAVHPLLIRMPAQVAHLPSPCYLIVARDDADELRRAGVALPTPLFAGQFYGSPYLAFLLAEPRRSSASAPE